MQIPDQWVSLDEAIKLVRENLMTANPNRVLNDWEAKYLNLRVDMRTGHVRIQRGNVLKQA